MVPPKDDEGRGGRSQPANTSFTFVTDETQRGARSHAMRQHWKQRQHRLSAEKQRRKRGSDGSAQAILPRGASSNPLSTTSSSSSNTTPQPPAPADPGGTVLSQAISGMNTALSSCKMDPFDSFPIKFTAQHHQLLHHWLVMYSTMVFDQEAVAYFNPLRDVWLPLDLSNAASFNAVMAHSAAHLAHMQGTRNLGTALEFKTRAIHIVARWMGDPALCTSDDLIAAVLRLLTYARYWGTEAEWRVHHEGLLRLIHARGGIEGLQSNWRVGLVAYLVSLMNEPSWFDTSNRIWEISAQHEREWVQRNVHKIRCLWLLSFVQDIRNFASVHLGGESSRGMARYTTTMDALGVLQQQPSGGSAGVFDEHEFQRLACLLMICVLIYRAFLGSDDAGADSLRSLESLLARSRGSWEGSVEGLYDTIFRVYLRADEGKSHYVVNMARTLGSLSLEARRGVENCLLYVVRRAGGGAMPDVDVFDDSRPTPDSLLASIHGD